MNEAPFKAGGNFVVEMCVWYLFKNITTLCRLQIHTRYSQVNLSLSICEILILIINVSIHHSILIDLRMVPSPRHPVPHHHVLLSTDCYQTWSSSLFRPQLNTTLEGEELSGAWAHGCGKKIIMGMPTRRHYLLVQQQQLADTHPHWSTYTNPH